jgi:hypothetical protein
VPHRKAIITLLSLFVFAVGAWAQTSPPVHHHPDMAVIDGSKNPELIPDATAYRLWLVTVSTLPNATEQERMGQKAHLAKLQLKNASDYLSLQTILSEFKSQYVSLINRYNESATAALAHGLNPDEALFLQQRNDLVFAARTAIAFRLSSEGVTLINTHVQDEKKHMQLHTTKEGAQ